MATSTAPSGFGRPIWNAIKGGNQVHGVGLVPVTARFHGTNAADFTHLLFTAPPVAAGGSWKVEAAQLVVDTTIGAEGTNFWTFTLQTGATATFTDIGDGITSETAITAGVSYSLDVEGPENASPKGVFLAAGDSVRIDCDAATGSSTNTTAVEHVVTLFLRHAPPGR